MIEDTISGTAENAFNSLGDALGRFVGVVDRWEFWGLVLAVAVVGSAFRSLVSWLRAGLLRAGDSTDEKATADADILARLWAIIFVFLGGVAVAWVFDRASG